jgi:hypothetical protein
MTKISMTATALTLALAVTAQAQTPGTFNPPGTTSKGLFGRAPAAKPKPDPSRDPNVLRSGEAAPEPVDELKSPKLPPLTEPIEPYLLQKENGPFMVSASSFTGPEAAKYAQILAMELRREYHLPAYVWLAKVQPNRSNIQGVQPTAPPHARNGDMAPPEKFRTIDEAAVLVGNCKTIEESKQLLKQVKGLRPNCIETFPVIYQNRKGKGLNRSMMTTNPFAPTQILFPGNNVAPDGLPIKQGQAFDPFVAAAAFEKVQKPVDPVVKRMNKGPNNITQNPGRYTIQVAEFSGRSKVMDGSEAKTHEDRQAAYQSDFKMSPLHMAGKDAEELAANLNKCSNMQGMKAYWYHTLSSSYVMIGSFSGPKDPGFLQLIKETQLTGSTDPRLKESQLLRIDAEHLKRGSRFPLHPGATLTPVPKLD